MTDDALYQARILALARDGAGDRLLAAPDARATVDNPVCGDRVTLDLAVDRAAADLRVAAIGHKTRGCALCEAATALIAIAAVGQTDDALRRIADATRALLQENGPVPDGWPDLAAFRPVAATKSRHRCVLLPFEALMQALSVAARDRHLKTK